MKLRTKLAIAILALGALCIIGAPSAASADAPPYTVSADGITLTDGGTFPAHGHVNWRTNQRSGGTHFDPNNGQPGGVFIGQSFYPIDLQPGECITWVQYSETNYHYGANGEPPVCAPATTPTPDPEPTTPSPSTSPSPTPTATPSPSSPATPTPTPSSSPSLSPPPTPTTTTSPQPEPEATPEPSATTPALEAQPPTADAPNVERLAATGGDWIFPLILALSALTAGGFILAIHRGYIIRRR